MMDFLGEKHMENNLFKHLKSKNISLCKFAEMIKFDRSQVSHVARRTRPGSRRLIRAIVEATEGACQESDFIMSEKKAGK